MAIQLIRTVANEIRLSIPSRVTKRRSFDLDFTVDYESNSKETFAIIFNVNVKNPSFSLKLDYTAFFHISEGVNDSFKKSHFPIVNAPAIAFPYLRAFVTNLTLNAGFEPVILPTVNFVNFKKDHK